jgi:hypothetical protein
MKRTLLPVITLLLLFSSCKKNAQSDQSTPTTINPSDAKAVTSGIIVYHSSKVTAGFPASTSGAGAPVLNTNFDNQQVNSFNGGYVIINPRRVSGTVAGYYLKVTGADLYYKIDFSKPYAPSNRLTRHKGRINPFSPDAPTSLARENGISDYQDSAIVILLPPNMGKGTFCVQYCMYDDQNQVSNTINFCIIVNQSGGGKTGAGFTGAWKQTEVKFGNSLDTNWTPTYQQQYQSPYDFFCYNNKLYAPGDTTWSTNPPIVSVPLYSSLRTQNDLTMNQDGTLNAIVANDFGTINVAASSCSNFNYSIQKNNISSNGNWGYNEDTKELIFIYQYNDNGLIDTGATISTVLEQTSDSFSFYDETDNIWYKYIKK